MKPEEPVRKRISLVKLGCFFTLSVVGFWVFVALVIVPRMLCMPPYSLSPVSHEAAASCKLKIRNICYNNYYNNEKIVISEKELNSFFSKTCFFSGINNFSVKITSRGIRTALTVTPLKISFINSFFKKKYFESVKKSFEKLAFRITIETLFWIDKEERVDFIFKSISIGIQKIPAELLSYTIKYFVPQYKMILGGFERTGKIVFGDGEILFFAGGVNHALVTPLKN